MSLDKNVINGFNPIIFNALDQSNVSDIANRIPIPVYNKPLNLKILSHVMADSYVGDAPGLRENYHQEFPIYVPKNFLRCGNCRYSISTQRLKLF